MDGIFKGTINLRPIFVGNDWVIGETTSTALMFGEYAKTENIEQLCKPDSTHEWCTINN